MIRLGSDYGGWTLPSSLIRPTWVCYSAGVGDDITFDLNLITQYGCTVHAFDPTPSSIEYVRRHASGQTKFIFTPCGIWSADRSVRFYEPDSTGLGASKDLSGGMTNYSAVNLHGTSKSFDAPCRSIQSIMQGFGHDHLDLLKLDIEGAEYEVIDNMLTSEVHPTVLCVEFHKTSGIQMMMDSVRRLRERGYIVVWLHGYDVTMVHESAN